MKDPRRLLGLLAALMVVIGLWWLQDSGGAQDGRDDRPAASQGSPRSSSTTDGLAHVAQAALPQQAQQVLTLIDEGGPFEYDRDGVVFENREHHLPEQPRGYYTEYTVDTPGSDDRGARRIVAGRDGDFYYTDDHYSSFRRVDR